MFIITDLGEVSLLSLEPEGPSNRIVPVGSEVQITCLAPKGYPAPTVTWHSQHPLPTDGMVRSQEGTLYIDSAKAVSYTHLDVYKRQVLY